MIIIPENPKSATASSSSTQPVLKWVGGKRQLLESIRLHLPTKINSYYEPFIGGGALLFDIRPPKAVINDVNAELINVYQTIRDDLDALIQDLKRHKNESEYYYHLRAADRENDYAKLTKVQRASRILYLNKTCYNGLFRVNSQGHFNVPFGRYKNPTIVNESALRAVHRYLATSDTTLMVGDFERSVEKARRGSFIYFDPPYHPISATSSFTGYAAKGFGVEDQIRLKNACDRLEKKGCKFLVSNSYCKFIKDLYTGYTQISIPASRNINSVGNGRGKILEVLIKNYQ